MGNVCGVSSVNAAGGEEYGTAVGSTPQRPDIVYREEVDHVPTKGTQHSSEASKSAPNERSACTYGHHTNYSHEAPAHILSPALDGSSCPYVRDAAATASTYSTTSRWPGPRPGPRPTTTLPVIPTRSSTGHSRVSSLSGGKGSRGHAHTLTPSPSAACPVIHPRPSGHPDGVASPGCSDTGARSGCVFARMSRPLSTPGAPATPASQDGTPVGLAGVDGMSEVGSLAGGSRAASLPGAASVGYSDFGGSSSVHGITLEERIASASVSMAGFGGSGSLPLSQLIDVLPTAIVGTDREGIIQMANRHAEELFGYEHGELQGKAIEILVPAHVREEHKALREMYQTDPSARPMGPLSKSAASGRTLSGQRKDGSVFPIEAGLSPLPPESGGLTLAAVVDVTGRVREEERLRMVVEAAPSGMVLVDGQGTITLVNRALETMFGYSRAQILGQRVEMLIHPRYRAQHVRWRTEYTRCPKARSMGAGRDLFGLRADGSEFPVEIGLQPIQAAGDSAAPAQPLAWPSSADSYMSSPRLRGGVGSVAGITSGGGGGGGSGRRAPPTWVLAAVVDISERKRAEELARAVDVAQRAIKSRGEILTHMSHELRTPLHGVIGTASLMADVLSHPEHKAMLATITTCADITLAVINDILDFSKIDAGRLDIETVEFEPRGLLSDIDSLFRTTALRKGLHYSTVCAETVPDVLLGDPTRIRQILVNVTSNALKFTPAGGRVSVKLTGEPCMIDVDVEGRVKKRRSLTAASEEAAKLGQAQAQAQGVAKQGTAVSARPEASDSASSSSVPFSMSSGATQQEVLVSGVQHGHDSAVSQSTAHTGGFLLRGVVTDTGPGISEAAQNGIFDPFVQGDTSTTRRFGGTGLGLAICKRLAGLMGGDISVRSSPGQGATFEFWMATGWDVNSQRTSVARDSPAIAHSGMSATVTASPISTPVVTGAAVEGADPVADLALATLQTDSPLVTSEGSETQPGRPRLRNEPGAHPTLAPGQAPRRGSATGEGGSQRSHSRSSGKSTPRSRETFPRPDSGSGPDSSMGRGAVWSSVYGAGDAGVRAKLEVEVEGQRTAEAIAAARSPRRSPANLALLGGVQPALAAGGIGLGSGSVPPLQPLRTASPLAKTARRFSDFHEPKAHAVTSIAPTSEAAPVPTILVADDNPVNVRLAKAFVVKAGYTPVLAVDGLQAVQLWARHCMPGQDLDTALKNIGHAALPLGETGATAASLLPPLDEGRDSHGRGQTAPAPQPSAQGAGSSSAEGAAVSASTDSHSTLTGVAGSLPLPAIEVVLMDCEMPVMSGFDAAKCIRELERMEGKGRHTRIIAVTASAMTGDRERCLAAGMDGYLAKPVRFQQLKAKLETFLALSASEGKGQAGTQAAASEAGAQAAIEYGQGTQET